MKEWFRSNGFRQYLMLEAESVNIDGFEVNMLLNYEGEWLLPVELHYQGNVANLGYEISGMISLEQSGNTKEIDGENLHRLFSSLWGCYEEVEEYLLLPEGILLCPERIYYQPGKKRFGFCYYPGDTRNFQEEMLKLAEFCMKHTSHQDSEAVLFIYELYHLLQRNQTKPEELKGLLLREQKVDKEFGWEIEQERNATAGKVEVPVKGMNESSMENEATDNRSLKDKNMLKSKKISDYVMKEKKQYYVYGGLAAITAGVDLITVVRFAIISHREAELKLCIILSILLGLLLYSVIRSRKEYLLQKDYLLQQERLQQGNDSEQRQWIVANEYYTEENNPPDASEYKRYTEETEEEEDRLKQGNCLRTDEQGETEVLGFVSNMELAVWELEEEESRELIPLTHLPGILGRSVGDVDYPVSGEGVSRRHLMLFLSGEVLYAEDLASTNGTFINGNQLTVNEPMRLSDGDSLVVGGTKYRVKWKEK